MKRKIFLLSMTLFLLLSFFTLSVLTGISVDEPDATVEELMEKYKPGDIPLDPETYQKYIRIWPPNFVEALPSSYDARSYGIVTPAKDQGGCGSCWAFASMGGFESSLLKEHLIGPTDLSEQQQVSCNYLMWGCLGGNSTASRYWETTGPVTETCFPYTALDTTPCWYPCDELHYYVINWHTVSPTTEQLKTSLYNDSPNYWRYNFYSDFYTFWSGGNPGDVYTQSWGSLLGGHAVLIIGWDDSKGAFLCKNSWGENAGPNDDGTFWIAYSGHAHNLNFGMSNFNVIVEHEYKYCFESDGWKKEFNIEDIWLVGEGSSNDCDRSDLLGWSYGNLYCLNWDIKTGTGDCPESIFYLGHISGLTYNWINTDGEKGSGKMVPCAASLIPSGDDRGGVGLFDSVGNYCFIDNYGNQYSLYFDGYYVEGEANINGCEVAPLVGAVEQGIFSWYCDIPTGTGDCKEGFILVGYVSSLSGKWRSTSGETGNFQLSKCPTNTWQ